MSAEKKTKGEELSKKRLSEKKKKDLGRPFQAETDWVYTCEKRTYYYNTFFLVDGPVKSYYSYVAYGAFIDFLFRKFGEREVLEYLLVNHDLSTLTDLSVNELSFAWQEDVEERFALLPKNNS